MKLLDSLKSALAAWDRFFFAPTPTFPVGVFRIVFGLNLLVMYSVRFFDWRFYYTDAGFVPSSQALEILPEFYRPSLSWFPTTPTAAFTMHALFLIALLALVLGIFGRLAAAVSLFLHLAFMQRNFAIIYGADLITTFFLFGLCFADNSRSLSLQTWLWPKRRRRDEQGAISAAFGTMGLRMMQIQLCVIYGFTGLEKMKGPAWWDGTAVWAVLGNKQIMMIDTSWLRHAPLAIAAMTLSTVLFEVYFPAIVWIKPLRKPLLAIGATMHLMIAFTVGLFFFSFNMMSTYLLFLDEADLRAFFARVKRALARRSLPPPESHRTRPT